MSLQERRWDGVEILVIYIDAQRFGEHHILSAVGVDSTGRKHILGIEGGDGECRGREEAADPPARPGTADRPQNTCS